MRRWLYLSILSLLALMTTGLFHVALADTSPIGVALDQRVIDLTHTLDTRVVTRLTDQLDALEQSNGAQVAVLMVPTTEGTSIEDYANRLFRAWKLGRKEFNDGILLVVAKDDRNVRIEVGYGLENTVTDVLAKRIIEERITPAFRQGDYAGGITDGVNALVSLVEDAGSFKLVEQASPLGVTAVLLAFVIGAAGGVLVVSRRLRMRYAVMATLVLTLLVGGLTLYQDWPLYPVVFASNMLVSAVLFAALWQFPRLLYGASALLVYIVSLLVVNQYNPFDWLDILVSTAVLLGGGWILSVFMKIAWDKSRIGFFVRLCLTVGVYVAAVLEAGAGLDSWFSAVRTAAIAALFIFGLSPSDFTSGRGSRRVRFRSRGSASSGGSSSSGSSGGGGSGRGGSSGGGGASGSW
ncbi:YgcG family protein [Pseudomonas sp. BIGb0164]|uniref:TPM domain-containing protein n=1 Tax=Pseudomonas sp. BIGb0164 TaxID=2940605 RepID=UPI0021686384|nr:YgcG family protein [Pseudomonas sp. BIGb0164]